MPMNVVYRGPGDLPHTIPVFPLPGALLLPRGQMPLNIFEPRYLAMIDDALADRHRLIGMIQPDSAHPGPQDKPNLFKIGCVGRGCVGCAGGGWRRGNLDFRAFGRARSP